MLQKTLERKRSNSIGGGGGGGGGGSGGASASHRLKKDSVSFPIILF